MGEFLRQLLFYQIANIYDFFSFINFRPFFSFFFSLVVFSFFMTTDNMSFISIYTVVCVTTLNILHSLWLFNN